MENLAHIGEMLPAFLWEMAVAIICGGLIGLERGRHQRMVGLRDSILICLGAVLYMNLSEIVMLGTNGAGSQDHLLIAAQVITAIGFIGAGVIVYSKGQAFGLTTAATIWIVAAIGLIIGSDQALLGMLVTGIILLILTMLHSFEKSLAPRQQGILLKLVVREDNTELRGQLQQVFKNNAIKTVSFRAETTPKGIKLTIHGTDAPEDVRVLIGEIWTLPGVIEVEH